jgi:hypothetical protein
MRYPLFPRMVGVVSSIEGEFTGASFPVYITE